MASLFQGELVRLAAPAPENAQAFAFWSENSEYLRLVDTAYAVPLSVADFADRFRSHRNSGTLIEFHIHTVADGQVIGFVALHSIEWNNQTGILAIGIGDPAYWGRGYGSEALQMMLRYAFDELNLYRVGLDLIADNTRALRAYEKAGFRHEGTLRGAVLRDGRRTDRIVMGLLRDEWAAGRPR